MTTRMVARDPELEQRARAGDAEAFEELSARYYGVLLRIARRALPDYHLAQDLTQEALLRAFTKVTRLRPEIPFVAWVARIVRNTAIDVLRRRRRCPAKPLEDLIDERSVRRRGDDPMDGRSISRREIETVWHEVNELRESERSVLLLRYARGLEVRTIANECGVSVQSVKARLHRGRRQLATRLLTRRIEEQRRPRAPLRGGQRFSVAP